jgi:hypothetical protein
MDLAIPVHFSRILIPVAPPTTDRVNSLDSTDHQSGIDKFDFNST